MLKSLLFSLFVTACLSSAEYNYNLQMIFKRGPTPDHPRVKTILDGAEKKCFCGKPPVLVMFFYGTPAFYCVSHIPEIEHVRPINNLNIDEFLNSLGSELNMNGSHCGMEKNGK